MSEQEALDEWMGVESQDALDMWNSSAMDMPPAPPDDETPAQ
ncbi:MAG: hypothetical protein ACOX4F_06875 [Atopobiaceae bacterium]|jgi:hypothetical protein